MTELERLIKETETDFFYLNETSRDVDELIDTTSNRQAINIEKAAASQYLSQFYNGIENTLKRILKYKGIPLPKSSSWHADLLNYFYQESEEVRIPLFYKEQFLLLISYRKIRHIIRQGYQYNLDWEKILIALSNVSSFLKQFQLIIMNYIKSE